MGTPTQTITYTYGNADWKDQQTVFNGRNYTYDAIGNPLSDGKRTYTWQHGRQLATLTQDGTTWTNAYNADGLRIQRTDGANTYKYYYAEGQLICIYRNTTRSFFAYTPDGLPYYITYGGNYYVYALNQVGDVVAILNTAGEAVVEYTYDAWGNILDIEGSMASTLGQFNPLRYRGYVYDNETGLYYVSSRYYDPEIGRFINADAAIGQIGNVQGTNMFAYCFNNPVNMSDPTGNWPKLSTIFTVVAAAAVAVAAVAVTVATCGAAAPALAVAGGGIIGGISAGAAATAASVATGAMIVAGVSTAAAVTSVVAEKAVEKTAKRNNSVYVLKDDAGTVQYVGRTNNVDKRRAAHSANPARAGLEMEVIASGLNLPESRALEQAGMAYYHTINTANKMNNQINSVSPKYWGAFKELALGTLNYGWNQMSNEILYWAGN